MLAAWRDRGNGERSRAIARSLALYAPASSATTNVDGRHMACAAPGAAMALAAPSSAPFGLVAFDGWLDDRAGCAGQDDARAYAAALGRWADGAERRLTGHYASAVWEADGTLRLARSPWRAPPLHYAIGPEGPVAASVVRALFAGGIARVLDHARLIDALYFDAARTGSGSWYAGVESVPLGSVVRIAPDGSVQTARWYDPHALVPEQRGAPTDWVEGARSLVAEAAACAAPRMRRPALALSGGLDSPLAAAALVAAAPAGTRPFAVTARPDAEWDGRLPPGYYGDEGPPAALLCAALGIPGYETHDGEFDRGLDDFHRAAGVSFAHIGNAGPLHALWGLARQHGADWFCDAVIGNDTLSSDAPWIYAEHLAHGRLGALAEALRTRPNDSRGLARRFAALALLPLLPGPLAGWARGLFSQAGPDFAATATALRPEVVRREGLAERAAARPGLRPGRVPTRREAVAFAWEASDAGLADLTLGLEQVYGLRHRDLLAYRPLVEYALRLPSAAFVRAGQTRWLARELLRGVVPEAQRTTTLYGAHNADWHLRLGRRRAALRGQLAAIGDHPLLGELIDVERLAGHLDRWPEAAPFGAEAWPLQQGLTNALTLARFVAQTEGRNAF